MLIWNIQLKVQKLFRFKINKVYLKIFFYIINTKMKEVFINESSYIVELLYDFINDKVCYELTYRFLTNELANEFIKKISINKNIVVEGDVYYEEKRNIMGYTDENLYKPRFNNVEDALNDFEEIKKNDYWNETNNYKYSGSLFTKPLIYFEVGFYKKECEKLKEENKKIKEEYEKLKEEYKEIKRKN